VPDYESFVRSACRLGPAPGMGGPGAVGGIRLYLADDVLGLWQRTENEFGTDQPPPFWAFAWPGGQALARYVLDHPALVTGRRALDLGSGSGLVAIAAARAGAAVVRASEIDPLAAAAIRLNAAANGVPVPLITGDVLDGDGDDDGGGSDVVLAGDVWYSRPLAARVLGFLERATARGALVLAGDIGRAFLPRDRFRVLDERDVPVMADLEDASVKRAMVLTPAWVPDCPGGNSPGANSPDPQRAMLGP
jgi:predicted nicotinamide N-methyase